MAALTGDVAVFEQWATYRPMPLRALQADTFYRGGLCFYDGAGYLINESADDAVFAGVCAEHIVITAKGEFVLVYTHGIHRFAAAQATLVQSGLQFAQAAAGHDDPGTIKLCAAGDTRAIGTMLQCITDATDGWFNIDDRIDAASA